MNLKILFAGLMSIVVAFALPFDTFILDFTAWTANEILITKAVFTFIGLATVVKSM